MQVERRENCAQQRKVKKAPMIVEAVDNLDKMGEIWVCTVGAEREERINSSQKE